MQLVHMTLPEARAILKALGVRSLLADPSDNPKLAKSLGLRVYTAPLHLAPSRLSGFQVCPKATAGCIAACLHTAGNPAYMPAKSRARIARTQAYFTARQAFLLCLVDEIERHVRAAKKRRMTCGVRLNATSDIRWETVPVVRAGVTYPNVMAAFGDSVSWYDYTKDHNRRKVTGYHLTYSLAEGRDHEAIQALAHGHNVATVFAVTPSQALPTAYTLTDRRGITYTYPVIDGDLHDYRPADPLGVIVGLRAKGLARKDTSGFVRKVA